MAKYYYNKYNVDTKYVERSVKECSNAEPASKHYLDESSYTYYSSYNFNRETGKFTLTGTTKKRYAGENPPIGYYIEGRQLSGYPNIIQILSELTAGNKYHCFNRIRAEKSQVKGTLIQSNIVAEYGTYPNNGIHTDGYWYVRQGLVNQAPQITGTNQDLGEVTDEINYEYTVSDPDGDTLSIIEKLNNEIIQVRNNVASNTTFTATITREKLYQLPLNQNNTLRIEVSDGTATTVRTLTFIRTNTPPLIEITGDKDLGNITTTPTIKYTVADPEEDEVDIQIKLNDETIKTYEDITLDEEQEYELPHDQWILLDQGEHDIKIIAIDAQGGQSYQKITFNKVESQIKVTTRPIETEIRVEQIIPIAWVDAAGLNPADIIKVYATNNALDEEPTWEEVTEETLAGTIYTFSNTDKTAAEWGIAIKIEVEGVTE